MSLIRPNSKFLRPLPYGMNNTMDGNGSIYLGGRQRPFGTEQEENITGADDDDGEDLREIPIPEVEVSDLEADDTDNDLD